MNSFALGKAFFWPALAAGLLLSAGASAEEYLHEDARIQGAEMHSFVDGGDQICVVLGNFSLTLNKREITGRDAVLWIRSRKAGELSYYRITAYVEGDAKITEPGGATTSDRVLLVSVRSFGRLSAGGGVMSDRPLTDFPLYRRAVETRKAAAADKVAEGPRQPITLESQPAETGLAAGPHVGPAEETPAIKVITPAKIKRVDPVDFNAKQISSQEVGLPADKRRITIAKGDVYIAQGAPESDMFLEMRADSAVIFTEPKPPGAPGTKETPYAPALRGMKAPGGGEEVITGAYLEGDVRVSRGERSMRSPSAFYDFTANRALILEPVFRTVQEQREIPIFVRAKEARVLSEREIVFKDAQVSSSDFYTPEYSMGAKRMYLKDTTPYDEKGERLSERTWLGDMKDVTYNLRGVPLAWTPESQTTFEEGPTPLRKASIGTHGNLGFGVESEWHLFRLLGVLKPQGFNATLDLDWYKRAPLAGVNVKYDRETYSGYTMLHGLLDQENKDDFGQERENILAPTDRGRALVRHKQFLPNDWTLQFELSYISDRNFLEEFFPDEAYAGKEEETLIYAKKQRDNWAVTLIGQAQLNRFQETTERAPEGAFYLIGQPLGDNLTFFHESRAGALKHNFPNYTGEPGSDFMTRLDTRNEIAAPMHFGALNVTPYAVGRATYWSDDPESGENARIYGQAGIKADTNIWRVYPDVRSRTWDLQGIKHVITPEVVGFIAGAGGVQPSRHFPWEQYQDVNREDWNLDDLRFGFPPEALNYLAKRGAIIPNAVPGDLYPMDPDIEQHLSGLGGTAFNLSQRLQTKRGPAENRRTVDWMRLDLSLGLYNGELEDQYPSDGRFFFYRPEYSIGRNHFNADYTWNISDSTAFLADMNYDLETQRVARYDFGVAVSRDPRLRYYVGYRRIVDLDSGVATLAITYRLNEKYSVSFMQQYDTAYEGGKALGTSITLIRKFPRWYVGATFVADARTDDLGAFITLWPEGIPEFRIGSGRTSLLSQSTMN